MGLQQRILKIKGSQLTGPISILQARIVHQGMPAKRKMATLKRVSAKKRLARQQARQRKKTAVANRQARQPNVQGAMAAMKAAKKIRNLEKAAKKPNYYKPKAQR